MSAELKALCELQTIDLALAKAQKAKASLDDGSSRKQLIEAVPAEGGAGRAGAPRGDHRAS